MDQYGCLHVNQGDADLVQHELKRAEAVVFPLTVEDGGALIVHISTGFRQVGTTPFGGNPYGRVYVGIYGRGCNHFSKDTIHSSYFEEKLDLHKSEAEALANFWEFLWKDAAS